jgi:ubiquitin-protein ligase
MFNHNTSGKNQNNSDDSGTSFNTTVSNKTKMRIVKDIKQIMKNKESCPNIHYSHDSNNMLRGYTFINGPSDTIYEHGFYLFDILYPHNYPYSPPNFKFKTTNQVRMHPNLYVNGKVCLSIINTWRGEGWTSSQNINSVLMTISSILTNNALTHEPGVTSNNSYNKHMILDFDNIIRFANLDIAFLKMLQGKIVSFSDTSPYKEFYPEMKQYAIANKDSIMEKIQKLALDYDKPIQFNNYFYNRTTFSYTVDYPRLLKEVTELYNSF